MDELDRFNRNFWIGMSIYVLVYLGAISFGIWVIIKLMTHFGII